MSQAQTLTQTLAEQPGLLFAVLVGSRASGKAHSNSDWDIALQWNYQLDWMDVLGRTETLRHALSKAINVPLLDIDLIELRRANLAMRASVAEEGKPLFGEETLEWAHFLQRTWRELEDFYWEKAHAV
jgi:predicted nucleotidyltransferase